MKKAVLLLVLAATIVFLQRVPVFAANSISLSDTKVEYDLPYVGMLPDHPLFIFKQIKNKITEILIRDPMRKAEYLLTESDKNINIAKQLAEKGKTGTALTYLTRAENDTSRLLIFLRMSKDRGVSPNDGFLFKIQLSNLKHREIIDTFVKELPQGQESTLMKIIDINTENKATIERMN